MPENYFAPWRVITGEKASAGFMEIMTMVQRVKMGLLGLVVAGAMTLSSGCTVSIDGLGDLGDYVVHVLDGGCYYDCGYDVIEIEYDD